MSARLAKPGRSYLLVSLDIGLGLLHDLLHFLLHRGQSTRITSVHLFLGLLLFRNGSIESRFEVNKGANVEWGYGLGYVLLPLDEAYKFVKFYEK